MKKNAYQLLQQLEERVSFLERKSSTRPMFVLKMYEERVSFDEETELHDSETEELLEENIYSFEELIETLRNTFNIQNQSWGEWSSSSPRVSGRGSDWITSYEEQDYRTGESIRVSLHFNPARDVNLDRIEMSEINKALNMR